MKQSILFACLLIAAAGFANDGAFYALGNTLMPLKETTIQLKKEVLNLTVQDYRMQVNIYFEFYNPGEEKEVLVGFVTPPAAGDIGEKDASHPHIGDFMVMVDGSLLPYKITHMDSTGFRSNVKAEEEYVDFVYYFTVKFKKGTTIIRHSYNYTGGGGVEYAHDYKYRLTTGATWANKEIEDFEMNIYMGDDVLFKAPFGFTGKKASWNIVGIGKMITAAAGEYEDEKQVAAVYLRKGFLQLKEKHFKPIKDLFLQMPQKYFEHAIWCSPDQQNDFAGLNDFFDTDTARVKIPRMAEAQLRLYRNLHFALAGYDFKDPLLKKTFSKYVWYIPDPNRKAEGFKEKYFNKEIQAMLEAEEKKRKK